jgi:hypothetical protein
MNIFDHFQHINLASDKHNALEKLHVLLSNDKQPKLSFITPQHYGIIEYIFIEYKIIEDCKLADGQTVRGRAMLSFNKKKNQWD